MFPSCVLLLGYVCDQCYLLITDLSLEILFFSFRRSEICLLYELQPGVRYARIGFLQGEQFRLEIRMILSDVPEALRRFGIVDELPPFFKNGEMTSKRFMLYVTI